VNDSRVAERSKGGEIAAGQGCFFGVRPAFQLEFALDRRGQGERSFDVNQPGGAMIPGELCTAGGTVLSESEGDVLGAADVIGAGVSFDDVDEDCVRLWRWCLDFPG
jgi:hypothetical protein